MGYYEYLPWVAKNKAPVPAAARNRGATSCLPSPFPDDTSEASSAKSKRVNRREQQSDADYGVHERGVAVSNVSQDHIASGPNSYYFSSDGRFVAARSKELNQRGRSHSVVVKLHKVSSSDDTTSMVRGSGSPGRQLTWLQVLRSFKDIDDKSFVDFFIKVILWADGFDDYYFETPAMLHENLHETPFEFTLIDAGGTLVNRQTSSRDFASYISGDQGSQKVKSFLNLGKDAMLLAPCHSRGVQKEAYGSLSTFMTKAPRDQIRALWRLAGQTALQNLVQYPAQPLWMSTDGRGVPWLHLRLDIAPKYYKHRSYAVKPSLTPVSPVPDVVTNDSSRSHVQNHANRSSKDEEYPTDMHISRSRSAPLADSDAGFSHDSRGDSEFGHTSSSRSTTASRHIAPGPEYFEYRAGAASVERQRSSHQTGLSNNCNHKAPTSKYGNSNSSGSGSGSVAHPPPCYDRSIADDPCHRGHHNNQPSQQRNGDAHGRMSYNHLSHASGYAEGAHESSSTVYTTRDSYAAAPSASKAPAMRDPYYPRMRNVTGYSGVVQMADTLSPHAVSRRQNAQYYRHCM